MNTPQRIILSVFVPLAVAAVVFLIDIPVGVHRTDSGEAWAYTLAAELPLAWLIAVTAVGAFEFWLWDTPRKGGGVKG